MFTGCPGCAQMVPSLTKVEEQFNNREVVFISISIDKNKVWKNDKNKYSAPGSLFLYTNNEGSDHPIIEYYRAQNYPQLVLIDKQGKLITNNAPDPRRDNGKELTIMIEEALR
jgi:thiol-disulfide isomerase/thioredoxin